MTAVVRLGTLLGFLVLPIACHNADRPTGPTSLTSPQPSTAQPPPTGGPELGLASTYVFSGPLSYPVQNYTATSRYVLRDGGGFSLEYPSLAYIGGYVGTYTYESGRVLFRFAADARWGAVGTFNGDSLEVRYNDIMGLSDFENAVYRRSQ
jgi:hypothetical protein